MFVWAPPRDRASLRDNAPAFDSPHIALKCDVHLPFASLMRDGGIEPPTTVWKTVILPLN